MAQLCHLERLGRFAAAFNIRGVPRLLYGMRHLLRSDQAFELKSGVRLHLNLADYFESMMLWNKYQSALLTLVNRLLCPGAVVIDGGAHIGFLSFHMARIVGPRGKVYAFEPDPRAHARLAMAVTLNGMEGIVEPFKLALASRDGPVDFFLSSQLGWSTAVPDSHLTNLTRTVVNAASIDSLVKQGLVVPAVSFVKLDLEGFEGEALAGMQNLLLKSQPFVMFEVNCLMLKAKQDSPERLARIFDSLGFQLYLIESHRKAYGPTNVRLQRVKQRWTWQDCDVLAVPHDLVKDIAGLLAA